MKRKAILSFIVIGILVFGAVLGSYAWFTSQVGSSENVFKTGKLVIAGPGTIVANAEFSNIYPGWTSSKTITIENEGTLDFKYRMNLQALTGNLLYDGPTPLQVSINNGDFKNINDLGYKDLGNIQAGKEQTVAISFKLPVTAGNDYQDKSANLNFAFEATQAENPSWDVKTANMIEPNSFGPRNDSGIEGFDVGFYLAGVQSQDMVNVQVSLYKGTTLLAVNKSRDLFVDYPNSPTGYSTPFDIDGTFAATGDDAWYYGQWLGLPTDVPTKVVITAKAKDGRIYTVEKTLAQ